MRLFVSIIATTAMFFMASTASAVLTWTADASSASGNALNELVVGDVVTIDITLRSDGETTLGVGGAASGYDRNVVSFTSGDAVGAILTAACIPALGCLGGMANLAANVELAEDNSNPAGPFVQFATAVDTNGVTNPGSGDEGIDGVAGSAQFQVVFTVTGDGSTTIDLGADPTFGNALIIAGGAQGTSNNTSVTLATVIPEPGTALLMGLGLAGLASAGRRE